VYITIDFGIFSSLMNCILKFVTSVTGKVYLMLNHTRKKLSKIIHQYNNKTDCANHNRFWNFQFFVRIVFLNLLQVSLVKYNSYWIIHE